MPHQNPNSSYKIWEPFLLALCLSVGMFIGYDMFKDKSDLVLVDSTQGNNHISALGIGRVEEILRIVENSYVDQLESETLIDEAITQIVNKLDPHSHYINSEEFEDYNQKMSGVYQGMGIVSKFIEDTLYVCHVSDDSEGFKAGLLSGDKILAMNQDTISGVNKDMNYVLKLLRNIQDDFCQTEVLRANELLNLNVHLQEQITSSADLNYVLNDNIGVVKVSRFSANTYDQFFKSLESIQEKLGRSNFDLILDLRNNPGGYVPQTLRILSQLFTEKNQLLSFTEGENRNRKDYKSTGRNFFDVEKIVVLINENSASASEIIAGAIQDWDRGVVIGTNSYGKGLVQEIFPLKKGGAIRLTVARYGTPSGRFIQRPYTVNGEKKMTEDSTYQTRKLGRILKNNDGISPDIEVESKALYNPQIADFVVSKILPYHLVVPLSILKEKEFDLVAAFDLEPNNLFQGEEDLLLLKAELIHSWYGPLPYYKFINSIDPTFAKAIEIISDEDALKFLASKEN